MNHGLSQLEQELGSTGDNEIEVRREAITAEKARHESEGHGATERFRKKGKTGTPCTPLETSAERHVLDPILS